MSLQFIHIFFEFVTADIWQTWLLQTWFHLGLNEKHFCHRCINLLQYDNVTPIINSRAHNAPQGRNYNSKLIEAVMSVCQGKQVDQLESEIKSSIPFH